MLDPVADQPVIADAVVLDVVAEIEPPRVLGALVTRAREAVGALAVVEADVASIVGLVTEAVRPGTGSRWIACLAVSVRVATGAVVVASDATLANRHRPSEAMVVGTGLGAVAETTVVAFGIGVALDALQSKLTAFPDAACARTAIGIRGAGHSGGRSQKADLRTTHVRGVLACARAQVAGFLPVAKRTVLALG